jgi:EpsI family protein
MKQRTRVLVSAILLLGASLTVYFRPVGEPVQRRNSFDSFPRGLGKWTGQEDTTLDPETLKMLKMSDYLTRRYVDVAGHITWLYIGYWQSQRKGADIHSPRNCLPGGGWDPVEASRLTIPLAPPYAPITVNRYVIQKDRQMQVVVYWFQAQGQAVSGELDAKIQMVRSAILKNRTDGALVRVSSPVSGSLQETTERLIQYIQILYPLLGDYLPE